jgi:hypothetical protein
VTPIGRIQLERARRDNVKRLARYLRIEDRGAVAERVARHLAELDMRNSWPPRLQERAW